MAAYYNEIDPYAAQWLRNLIDAGHIAVGDVDERSIVDVRGDDLRGYTQCHFFAGIGGWSLALRLAGWPDDRPVWTGSCPCPPFSAAGKRVSCSACKNRLLVWCPRRTGFAICADCGHAWLADARHLWPEFWRLIAERRPARIFGEQVASEEGLIWLAAVRGSLEILRYDVGAADLPACSVGAPHIRQRLWWVANDASDRCGQGREVAGGGSEGTGAPQERCGLGERRHVELADTDGGDASAEGLQRGRQHGQQPPDGSVGWPTPTANPANGEPEAFLERKRRAVARGSTMGVSLTDLQMVAKLTSWPTPTVHDSERGGQAKRAQGMTRHGSNLQDFALLAVVNAESERRDGRSHDQNEGQRQLTSADRSKARELGDASNEGLPPCECEQLPGAGGGNERRATEQSGGSPWADLEWLECADGKARPTQPGLFPLAHGIPGRVGRLRAYGNAIIPQVAAEFIRAATLTSAQGGPKC